MSQFNNYTSVLTEGFTARDANPPGNPSKVKQIIEENQRKVSRK